MGTVAVLALDSAAGDDRALEDAGRRLRRLQTALRLWDDAEPSLGPTAWARTGGGAVERRPARHRHPPRRRRLPARPPTRRTRCARSARSSPAARRAAASSPGRCGASSSAASARARVEALTDWLLAARALLADPDAPGYDGLAERLAVICATPEERAALERRLDEAIRLERAAIAGRVRPDPRSRTLIADLGGNLRAVLRDVLCGHLDPQLRRVADEMLDAELARASSPNRCSRTSARPSTSWTSPSSSGTTIVGGSPSRVAQPLDARRLARGERRQLVRGGRRRGAARSSPSSAGSGPSRLRRRGACG